MAHTSVINENGRMRRDEPKARGQVAAQARTMLLKNSRAELQETCQQLEKYKAQLIHSEKMASLGQLAAGIAHEVNNPIGFVMCNLGTLASYVSAFRCVLDAYETLATAVRDGDLKAQQQAFQRTKRAREQADLDYVLMDVDHLLKESLEGARRVKEIVQGLKSFARANNAEMELADINMCIEDILKLIENELKYKARVHRKFGNIPRVLCFTDQLKQVFMNLLVNAVQAIPDQGDITIETEMSEEDISIRISDTGKGIPEGQLSEIFTPFFTTKAPGEGTGLGLSISREIIQRHRGTITAESQVGFGTAFTIRLPITP